MKHLLILLSAFQLFSLSAFSQRALQKNPTTGALLEGFKSGSNTIELSATGTLLFNDGFTLTGGSFLKTALSLNSVENTALSTWAGTSSLTTLGTITAGTWTGTAIAVANGGTGSTTASDARTALGLGTLATQSATIGDYLLSATATSTYAPLTRSISAGGLATGGGDLSTDRTITVTAASQAEAEAGSNTTAVMTPQRTSQAITALAGGRVLQMVLVTETGTPSAGTSFATLMTNSITMINASSKVLIFCSGSVGTSHHSSVPIYWTLKIQRGGADVLVGAASGSRTRTNIAGSAALMSVTNNRITMAPFTILISDTPGAGTHSYTLMGRSGTGSSNSLVWLNRSEYNLDTGSTPVGATSFLLVEVAP